MAHYFKSSMFSIGFIELFFTLYWQRSTIQLINTDRITGQEKAQFASSSWKKSLEIQRQALFTKIIPYKDPMQKHSHNLIHPSICAQHMTPNETQQVRPQLLEHSFEPRET